jgi:hypothetical protein
LENERQTQFGLEPNWRGTQIGGQPIWIAGRQPGTLRDLAARLPRYPETLAGNHPDPAVKLDFPLVLSTIFAKAVGRLIISGGLRKISESASLGEE